LLIESWLWGVAIAIEYEVGEEANKNGKCQTGNDDKEEESLKDADHWFAGFVETD
jgi:hypothetical protein